MVLGGSNFWVRISGCGGAGFEFCGFEILEDYGLWVSGWVVVGCSGFEFLGLWLWVRGGL